VPFVLSVPATSAEQAISAEAAHLVFGLGGTPPLTSGMKAAAPWTDWNTFYIRNSNSGSTILTALLIDVPRTKFWGIDTLSTENLRDTLLAAPNQSSSSAIGILSIDFYDKNRGNLKALFLQARDQKVGYLPDSGPTTIDKINVRDGHYPLWGYVHLFTADPNGVARNFIVALTAQKVEQRLLDDVIAASLIPQCAMKVARTGEMGDFVARTGFSCSCYFDAKTNRKPSCQTCDVPENCPAAAPSCNYGYCEKN
jgi:ABC-type phosphate transport system substrate-binding protein